MRPNVTRADGGSDIQTYQGTAAAAAAAVGLSRWVVLSIFAVGRDSSQLAYNYLLTQDL